MTLPADYPERVYAGVLGKIIGVYLGRPFEGWTYERISAELGEIQYYVHERLNKPLIVTDDDIAGTFTFVRALADYDYRRDLTPAQIGQTWLNYLIEGRTVLWWGGLGNSTEHTAYLRLKNGIAAPRSGSRELNGTVVSEQIGSQIFIDGWAMAAPGDPELAADLARRAASVSHDGEAIYGAQVIAAMEAQAFVESDRSKLLDTALSFIPRDCIIARMISDIRNWHAGKPDWRTARALLAEHYGYDTYGGNCHMVPNHGLIILAFLYGDDDFQKSLMIVNTGGWDTDCNSGNLGCLMGIKNGLAGIEAGPDWRGPLADRLYISTADGGRCISDAVSEAYHLINAGRALAGEPPLRPKNAARFHFEMPGAVQGFRLEESIECRGTAVLENVAGHSRTGKRSLAVRYRGLVPSRTARLATPVFIPPEAITMPGYTLLASPALHSGQVVSATLSTDPTNAQSVTCGLYVRYYGGDDRLVMMRGPRATLGAAAEETLQWQVPATGGCPIAEVGVEISGAQGAQGTIYLDYLTWTGAPNVVLGRPEGSGTMWLRAWVDAVDQQRSRPPECYRLMQNRGRGMIIQGSREWTDYRVGAELTPHMAQAVGLAVRVQGLERYYALLLCNDGQARLVKKLDGEHVLASTPFPWELGRTYKVEVQVKGADIEASLDDRQLFRAVDSGRVLEGGAVALVCEEGRLGVGPVTVAPLRS